MEPQHLSGISYDKNGWTYISIWGDPYNRGIAYGYYSAPDFIKIQEMLEFYVYETTGRKWTFFVDVARKHFTPKLQKYYPELYSEIEGITKGCIMNGVHTDIHEIVAWNNYITIIECWYPMWMRKKNSKSNAPENVPSLKEGGSPDKCSAFIANGKYTKDGKIVVAHNSFVEFIDGQFYKIILDINPSSGHRILMQTSACSIWSGTDFFVTAAGIVGTETTIGGFLPYQPKMPISCRIRTAMQYGSSLDDYVSILLDGNSGDYANSWLLGNIHTNEIMRFELGLKYWDVQRTTDGYYYGCNFAFSPEIRNFECVNTGYCDIRRHQGARQVRIPDLIEKSKGRIDTKVAQTIISDHFDVYLQKTNPCSRTICSHYELDAREYMSDPGRPKPYTPKGAIDGMIADADMIRGMSFLAKYGSSCKISFNAHEFCSHHSQWGHLEPYLLNRPYQPWTLFDTYTKPPIKIHTHRIKNKTKRQSRTRLHTASGKSN
jgi:hypothetical protein